MALINRSPQAELDKVLVSTAEYRGNAAKLRAAGEEALEDRDLLASREADGELTPESALAEYRNATSRAEQAFEEAERLDAVAAELDQRAEALRAQVEELAAADRRSVAEKANGAAVAQSARVAAAARMLAGEVSKLEKLRTREDELRAAAAGVSRVDEPDWLDRTEHEQIVDVLAKGPRRPNAQRERARRDADRIHAETVDSYARQVAQGNSAALQLVPEALVEEVEQRAAVLRGQFQRAHENELRAATAAGLARPANW